MSTIEEFVRKDKNIARLIGEREGSLLKYPFDRIPKEVWDNLDTVKIDPSTDDGARYFEERNQLKYYLNQAIMLLREIEDKLSESNPDHIVDYKWGPDGHQIIHRQYKSAIEAFLRRHINN